MRQKAHNNHNKIQLSLIIIFGLILVVGSLFMLIRLITKLNTVSYQDYNFYQYFSGVKVDYSGTITYRYDQEPTDLNLNGSSIELDATPIYFADIDNSALLAQDMALVIPRIREQTYKVHRLSKITIDGDVPILSLKDKQSPLETPSFLYDGNNLYWFLSPVTIKIDDQTFQLSPLSYVIANYHGDLEIYDKSKDQYIIAENTLGDIVAEMDDYKIDLGADVLFYNDSSSRLLIKSINKLRDVL